MSSLSLRTAASYGSFGFLTVVFFVGWGFLPERVSADEALQTVTNMLTPKPAVDVDRLVKVGDRTYAVAYEDSVSMEPLSTTTVRKIGYGKTEFVTITETPSGTYSSDAMTSPNVSYPGIHLQRVAWAHPWRGWVWVDGAGWMSVRMSDADSFLLVTPTDEGAIVSSPSRTCIISSIGITC